MDKKQARVEKEVLQKKMAELDKIIEKPDAESDKITSRIKTMKDVYKIVGVDTKKDLPDVSRCLDRLKKTVLLGYDLMLLCDVLNEGWVADPTNHNEYRHTPWVEIMVDKSKPSGFGFSGSGYNYWSTYTDVAARLSLRNAELAMFVIKQFPDLLAEYLCG